MVFTDAQLAQHLVTQLRQMRVVPTFDEKPMVESLTAIPQLKYVPSDQIGYYQTVVECVLHPRDGISALLRNARAVCQVVFTSISPNFQYPNVIGDLVSGDDRLHGTISLHVRICDEEHFCLVGLRKQLWTSEGIHVEGYQTYARLFTL